MSESDDERARARATILQRRARLVAYAVATGVVTAACSGRTTCLEPPTRGNGMGGTPVTTGGTGFCLSAPGGSSMGGTVTVACLSIAAGTSTGGTPITVCLEPIVGGAPSEAAGAGAGGEPDAGGAGSENTSGTGGTQPFGGTSICLAPPKD